MGVLNLFWRSKSRSDCFMLCAEGFGVRRCIAALVPGPLPGKSKQSGAEAPHSKAFGQDCNIRVQSGTWSPLSAVYFLVLVLI